MPRKKPPTFESLPKWRIERIIEHSFHGFVPVYSLSESKPHPWRDARPSKSLREYALAGVRSSARSRRIKSLIKRLASDRLTLV